MDLGESTWFSSGYWIWRGHSLREPHWNISWFPSFLLGQRSHKILENGKENFYLFNRFIFLWSSERESWHDLQLSAPCALSERCPTFLSTSSIWCTTLLKDETCLQRRTFWSCSHSPIIHPFWAKDISRLLQGTQHVGCQLLESRGHVSFLSPEPPVNIVQKSY